MAGRKPGRPREFDTKITIRVDDRLRQNLDVAAGSQNLGRAAFMRVALAQACAMA